MRWSHASLVAAACLLSHHASAQEVHPVGLMRAMPSVAATRFAAAPASLCDGSPIIDSRGKQQTGKIVRVAGWVGLFVLPAIAIPATGSGLTGGVVGLLGGGALIVTGNVLEHSAQATPDDWDKTLAKFKVGQTSPDDVRSCLGSPNSTSTSMGEQTWGYVEHARSVTITFKNGVFSDFRKSEAGS